MTAEVSVMTGWVGGTPGVIKDPPAIAPAILTDFEKWLHQHLYQRAIFNQKPLRGHVPGGPVANKTPCFQCRGPGLIPGQGTRSHMPKPKYPACHN